MDDDDEERLLSTERSEGESTCDADRVYELQRQVNGLKRELV